MNQCVQEKREVLSHSGEAHMLSFPTEMSLDWKNERDHLTLGPTHGYRAGVCLFSQGQPARYVYLIKKGVAKLSRLDESGKEVIIALRGPGWLLGYDSAILGQSYPTTAETITACQLQQALGQDLRILLRAGLEVSWHVQRMLASEIRDNIEGMSRVALCSVRHRLISLFFQILREHKQCDSAEECIIEMPLTQRELAQLLATTPEHVCRVISGLEEKGLISRSKRSLIIRNPRKLFEANLAV